MTLAPRPARAPRRRRPRAAPRTLPVLALAACSAVLAGAALAPASAAQPAPAGGRKDEKGAKAAKAGKAAKKVPEAAGADAPRPRPWWNRAYAGRRRVLLEKEPARGEAVLLTFSTGALTRPDGRDVRLVADHQTTLPLEVLEVGPGDRETIGFEAPEPGHELDVYLGCPFADSPRRPAREIRGGLRLEVRAFPPGPAGSWPEMAKLLKAAGDPVGVLFPDSIGLGAPPLGRPDALVRYAGALRVEKAGEHRLETASDGPSFALVDGKVIAAWPGFHDLGGYADPERRKEHSGTATLAPGLHSIEYVTGARGGGIHMLGLQGPGEASPQPIPPARLASWARARAGPLELPGEAAADVSWRIAGDTLSDADRHPLALVELEWSGDLAGRTLGEVEWDFGDGQRGKGEKVRHAYLGHGVFPVTATAQAGPGKTLAATRRVGVRFESTRLEDLNRVLEECFGAARDYDLAALPEEHLAMFVWLAKKDFRWEESLHRAVEAYYARGFSPARDEMARDGLRRARELVREREGFDRAESILERVAREGPLPADRGDAAAWLAASKALRTDSRRDEAAAEAALRKLRAEGEGGDAGRRASIFLAGLLLQRGKADEAEALLREAETGPYRRFEGERQVASGSHALAFDSLLRRGDLREAREELERWDWELPADRLEGHLGLRRAALLRKEKKLDAALRELAEVKALRGAANQVPRALLLEAEVLEERGDREGARKALERVVGEFGRRPERKEAEERLAGLAR